MPASISLTPIPDELSPYEALLIHEDVNNGFVHQLPDFPMTHDECRKFLKLVLEEYGEHEKFDYSLSKNDVLTKYVFPEMKIVVRGNSKEMIGAIFSKKERLACDVWDVYKKIRKDVPGDVQVFQQSYFSNYGKIEVRGSQIKPQTLNYLSELYYPYLDTEVMLEQFFTGAENILIVVGDPGLGKSKLSTLAVKYLFAHPEKMPYDKTEFSVNDDTQYANVAYVKSTEVLSSDRFWHELKSNLTDVCIIDDLDFMLTKRDADVLSQDDVIRNKFLNQFLSFTDGVEKTRTKFIITTNQTFSDIDTALIRKGRLFDILELRALYRDEALNVWKDSGLDETEFDSSFFDKEEITAADLGSEISKTTNSRIDPSILHKSYLAEPSVSKMNASGKQKSVGVL